MTDRPLKNKLDEWFDHNIADGWVELDPWSGMIHVEVFAESIRNLGLKPGDYVKLKVVTSKEIQEAGSAE